MELRSLGRGASLLAAVKSIPFYERAQVFLQHALAGFYKRKARQTQF